MWSAMHILRGWFIGINCALCIMSLVDSNWCSHHHHHHRLDIHFSLLAGVEQLLPYSGQVAAITKVTPPEWHFHFQVLARLTAPRVVADWPLLGDIDANFKLAGCPSWCQTHLWDWPIICWCADNGAVVFFRWHQHQMQFTVLPRMQCQLKTDYNDTGLIIYLGIWCRIVFWSLWTFCS